MALQVIELDNDPASLSLVDDVLGAAFVAFVLVGGIAADRINQRTIIIAIEIRQRRRVSAVAVLGLVGALRDLAHGGGLGGDGHRGGVLLSRPTARSCRGSCLPTNCWRPTASRAWCARCSSAPSVLRSPGCGGRDVPRAGRGHRGGVVRRRPGAAGGDPVGDENACRRAGSRAATRAARSARRLRLHAAHPVAAVDPAVRQHVRAGGAGTDRGAAAVHRQRPVRRRRQDIRLHPGVLRDGQRAGRAGGVVATAAPALPVGDDGDVEPRLRPAGGASASRRRSR